MKFEKVWSDAKYSLKLSMRHHGRISQRCVIGQEDGTKTSVLVSTDMYPENIT